MLNFSTELSAHSFLKISESDKKSYAWLNTLVRVSGFTSLNGLIKFVALRLGEQYTDISAKSRAFNTIIHSFKWLIQLVMFH